MAHRVRRIAAFLAQSFLSIVDPSSSVSMENGKTRLATMDWSILTRLSRNVSRPMFFSAAHVVLLNVRLLLPLQLRPRPRLLFRQLFLRLMLWLLLKRNPKKTCLVTTFTSRASAASNTFTVTATPIGSQLTSQTLI